MVMCAAPATASAHDWTADVHRAVHDTHHLQYVMGRPLTPYHGHTRFQTKVLWMSRWRHLHAVWFPWPAWWRDEAGCIHRHESIDWHNPTYDDSQGGGMQFLLSTWRNAIADGVRFAPVPELATRHEQLLAAWGLYSYDGDWHEWTTAPMCGLS